MCTGVEQLRDSVVPGVRVFDPSDPPLPHLYRACVHTALCTVSRCCVWVDQFAEVFKFANAADLALPVKFGNVPYSMEEYLRQFMSPHTVRVFECDGRAAVTLAMPDTPPEERRRETDWLDDRLHFAAARGHPLQSARKQVRQVQGNLRLRGGAAGAQDDGDAQDAG